MSVKKHVKLGSATMNALQTSLPTTAIAGPKLPPGFGGGDALPSRVNRSARSPATGEITTTLSTSALRGIKKPPGMVE